MFVNFPFTFVGQSGSILHDLVNMLGYSKGAGYAWLDSRPDGTWLRLTVAATATCYATSPAAWSLLLARGEHNLFLPPDRGPCDRAAPEKRSCGTSASLAEAIGATGAAVPGRC